MYRAFSSTARLNDHHLRFYRESKTLTVCIRSTLVRNSCLFTSSMTIINVASCRRNVVAGPQAHRKTA